MSWIDNLFKTKQQREEDMDAYYRWAYPYGNEQKDRILEIIKTIFDDEDEKIAVYNYLVCRQEIAPKLYEGPFEFDIVNLNEVVKKLKKQYNSKGKKNIHKYIALVEADLKIDESLNYPSIESIIERSEEIKSLI